MQRYYIGGRGCEGMITCVTSVTKLVKIVFGKGRKSNILFIFVNLKVAQYKKEAYICGK
jgi:hypothetical protein